MTLRYRTTLFCLVLILLSVIVFEDVRNHQFVFDDLGFIVHNSMVKDGLTWNGFIWALTTWHTGSWHPLTWLSHMLDCQIFGLNATGPHLTNLFFHTVNSVLLFLLLQFCTGEALPGFIVAALFAVHPLHVESVAWVAERKDVLSTFFWLLTMWAYCLYVRNPEWKHYLLIILCFCLGLMAKPMLVTLPLVFLLWDYWPLHRWVPTGLKVAGKDKIVPGRKCPGQRVSWKRLVGEKVPLFVLVIISSLGAFYSQKTEAVVVPLADLPLSLRINNALVAYASYIGKTVWPMHLAVYYPHPGNTIPLWESLGAILILVVLSCSIFSKALNYPYLLVGWLWFLGTLVPVIGLVQVGGQSMADRYTYIPLIGLFIMLAWGLSDLLAKWRCSKLLMPMVSGAMILIFATCAWFQVRFWRNSVSLFEHAVNETSDNPLA
jgi:protein O-mannosyl-transferase